MLFKKKIMSLNPAGKRDCEYLHVAFLFNEGDGAVGWAAV